jgi:hypothetical protein
VNRAGPSTVSNKRIGHGPIVAARDNTTLAHLEEQRVSTLIQVEISEDTWEPGAGDDR